MLEQDDVSKDPRFAMTAEELKKKGIEDFQLQYALNTLKRLAKPAAVASSGGQSKSRR